MIRAALPALLVLMVGLAGCQGTGDDGKAQPAPVAVGKTVTDSGQGGATVKATLEGYDDGRARFNLTLDTHSVDLTAYDPTQHTALEDAAGSQHSPAAGSRVTTEGNHHKEAIVYFETPGGSMTLVVKDLSGVPERRLLFVP